MNIRSMRADLVLKQTALKDAEKTLRFFTRSKDCSPELLKEMKDTIISLRIQIADLEKMIKKENGKKKS